MRPHEFCLPAFRGKHASQKKQITSVHRFHIDAERLGRRREIDPKLFQSLLRTGRVRIFAG
jgi:hypothetical protein